MQVVVLGMHRSGTSVLTHLLSRMGCHAGPAESLMPGDASNARGYWESWDAWALDERILAAAGASWWEVADLDLGTLAEADRQLFTAAAGEVVAGLDERRPWVLKDPRLCVVLPLWRPALSSPVFVIVHREPLETARSLQARDGFPLAVGIALWEVYNLAALRHSLGAPRVGVSYGRLSADPGSVAASLAVELGPWTGGALAVPEAADLAAVVAGEEHHQRARPEERDQHLNASQRRLSQALDDGSALAWEEVPPCSAGALDTLRSFAAGERERLALRGRAEELASRCSAAEGEAAWLRDREAEQLRWVTSLREALDVAEAELGRLRPSLAELEERGAELEKEAVWLRDRDAEQSRWIASLQEALREAEAELEPLRLSLAGLEGKRAELEEHRAEREERLAELEGSLEELKGRQAALEEEAAWLRDRDAEQSRWIASLREALESAEAELGRLRQRDAEISVWNETLTARLAEGEREAGQRAEAHREEVAVLQARHREEAAALQARHDEKVAALTARFEAEAAGLEARLETTLRSWRLETAELRGVIDGILRSRTWRLGRFLTAPVRWVRR